MKKEAVLIYINQDMSVSSNSIGIDINQEFSWSIQAVWTGTPVGTLSIEVSNDIVPVDPSNTNPVGPDPAGQVINWSTYTGSLVVVSGTDGNWMWIAQLGAYRWVRLAYEATSGSGTLNATMFGKG